MATFPSKVNYVTGEVLTATNMNDVGGAINLLESAQYAAGKNKIINGDFSVWQRGTSFSNPASGAYNADRWLIFFDGTGATRTISRQAFTPGTAPVAGYEGQYFLRYNLSAVGTSPTYAAFAQRIENVQTYAGQTVTYSFWAKAASSVVLPAVSVRQDFGSGGSGSVTTYSSGATLTTSWARYTFTFTVPSISGKTVGTSSYLELQLNIPVTANTIDFWGVQLEAASTASNFQTATGTIQGELAACQRYYAKVTSAGSNTYAMLGNGIGQNATTARVNVKYPQTLRTVPSSLDYSTIALHDGAVTPAITVAVLGSALSGTDYGGIDVNIASGGVAFRPYFLLTNGSAAGYVGFNAEL